MNLDFLCIGVQKAATSQVYSVLSKHPEIHIPEKEFYFFSPKGEYKSDNPEQINFDKSLDWYKKQFKKDGRKKGEISTHYIYDSDAAERIKKAFPDVKLFAILRNPIERAISHYKMEAYKYCKEDRDLLEIIEEDPANEIIQRGKYHKQLQPYFQIFNAGQIKIFFLEDLKNDPEAFFEDLFDYVSVDPSFRHPQIHKKKNESTTSRFRSIPKLLRRIRKIAQKSTFGSYIISMLEYYGIGQFLRRNIKRINLKEDDTTFDPRVRKKLHTIFKDDIEALENLLNKDLSHWKS